MLETIWDKVWDIELWFPKSALKVNFTWTDLENQPGSNAYYPDVKDLHWSVFLGILLLGFRYVFESLVVVPIAIYCGVSTKARTPLKENRILEQEFQKNKSKVDYKKIQILSKRTDLTCRQIEVWFRKRKQRDAPTQIQKVKECSWHFIFYGTAFVYGSVILWEKSWLWDTKYCWMGFPQTVDRDVYWYYMIELAFYWSLVFTIFSDHKRKDFTEMIVHHVATIFLMYFSWLCDFVRVGTLVLLVHDAADPWLAIAKLFKYTKYERCTETCFGIFILVWIVSRLFCYPYYVLYSTTVEPYDHMIHTTCFTHWFFNVLLYTLMLLHILWSYSIFRIVLKKIASGQVEDVRSDSDEEEDSDTDQKNHIGNGGTDHIQHKTNGVANGSHKLGQ